MAEFKIGDKVIIKDPLRRFSGYIEFLDTYCKETDSPVAEAVRERWLECQYLPVADKDVYEVMWVHQHLSEEQAEKTLCVIANDKYAYIYNAEGLDFVPSPDEIWAEYIRYIRNWSAANREYTGDPEDKLATGPRSYGNWLAAQNKTQITMNRG